MRLRLGPAPRVVSLDGDVADVAVTLWMKSRSAVPTGRVKWYDAAKGYGFVTSDEGGDVFLPKGALPAGVSELKSGQRIEFGVVDGRKGAQALGVSLLEAPP